VLSLKRKRDWCGTCDDDAGSLVQGRGGSCSMAKRTKLRSAGDHVPRTLTLTLTTTPQRHVQLPSQDFTFDSRSNLTTPTSSCRLEQRPSPLSQSELPLPSEPIPTSQDKCTTEDSTQPEEAGTSVITDLQDSLTACTIEPKSQAPAPTPVHEPFGFDTTLSNVQYGFSKSRPYRFSSPLSPQPGKRKRSKSHRHRSKAHSLLKSTLQRNHITSLRKRFPEIFTPRYLTHPEPLPQLDNDDDDDFDDDEDDEVIDDFDDDDESQVDDIVNMYSRGVTPGPEEIIDSDPETLGVAESLIALVTPRSKPLMPLQPSSAVNIPKELTSKPNRVCVVAA